jgi:PAS domain S-box-containing protein
MITNRKTTALDKILGRVDDLDTVNLSILVQRLARERDLMETVFNTIQDGILVIDNSGIIQYANDRGCELIGLSANQIGSAILWKLVPDLYRCVDVEGINADDKGAIVVSRELELTYPEQRFVRLYMVPLYECIGVDAKSGFTVILSDTTEQKVSTEELIETEKTSSIMMLAAGVAHELGNPLNSITIHLQLIERHLKKLDNSIISDKIRKSIGVCSQEVERLDGIITNFLEAVRPKPPDLRDTDIIRVLEEVLEFQSEELSAKGVNVSIDTRAAIPIVKADPDQIKQVFFNLIKNALEAMESRPKLKILARSDDDFISIQFLDTGTGISQENIKKLFTPYFSTKKQGNGLGMMIVQRIMRDHGGSVGIDSKEGTGTIVTLRFPLKDRRVRLLESKVDPATDLE